MRLGIFAKTFPGTDPHVVLASVREAGFSAAQYNMACSGLPAMPDAVSPTEAERVASAARAAGVGLVALSGTYNMIHPDPARREEGHRRLEALAAAAPALGTRLVTLCTGTRDPDDQWRGHADNGSPEAWRDLLRSMETALAIAERHEIDLGIEPELANVVDGAAKARRLIDELGSPRLRIVLDPANLFEIASAEEQRRLVSEAVDLLGDRIAMGHAKDRAPDGAFVAAGKGVLDYPHYLRCLGAIGFRGALVTHGLEAAEAPGVARFLRAQLAEAGLVEQNA
ncbi:sugar phosphate isomerase/epimerase family protein [Aureimonas sp. AU40]|uniref:sugar phosphate isomerase/epimerase family protein n=1 Tax=Aureimonas sp. AU40 TaxID=1637747 RepID=UPI0007834916|nr:sugar phosphate isomerase/epimerase [Aureimonas sp. AU40]